MKIIKCLYNRKLFDFIIKRTCIIIKNNNFQKIIGFFDMKYYLIKNKLIIENYDKVDLIIKGNNINLLYNTITKYMNNLRYDIRMSDLIITNNKNIDFQCVICLENKNTDIIKLKCCNNILHYNCYLDYLKKNNNYSCPICRDKKCPICFGLNC